MNQIVSKIKTSTIIKWLLSITIIFVLCLLVFFLANVAIASIYQGKFLRGTRVAGVDISSLSVEEAKGKIDKRLDFIGRRGFVYNSNLKTVVIYPTIQAVDSPDASYELVHWDVDNTLGYLLGFEQTKNPTALWKKLNILIRGENFPLGYNWHRGRHADILRQNFADVLNTKQDAGFIFDGDNINIIPEKSGQTLDYQKALQQTEEIIKNLLNTDIALEIINDKPTITANIVAGFKNQIKDLAGRGDMNLVSDEKKWTVPASTWKNWLLIKNTATGTKLGFSEVGIAAYFEQAGIKSALESPVKEAKFQLSDGRVTEFVASQEGRVINLSETVNKLDQLINQATLVAELVIDKVQPQVRNQEVNELGIVQLLGTGTSDFKGSPPNRIHNIGVGAKSLNGILITPGEDFSLLKALGEIDGQRGYKEELVIKGNKTIPEFGGGLCQIGTTVFRAALASGLPILERRNHSYRVRYYEPAGMDATIYNPWPDFKFSNDTGKYILVQTRIEGVKLYFDFWGTSDGRIAQTTEPVAYNIVKPPEKKIIKTTDLPVGKVKCTESAHNGADAKFIYTVKYPTETEPREETFYSHYVPWQEVCLLGVTEEDLLLEQSSSTPIGL